METLRPVIGRLPFEVELEELDEPGEVAWRGEGFRIAAFPTRHSVAVGRATPWSRTTAPGRLRRRRGARARRARGPRLRGAPARRRGDDAGGRTVRPGRGARRRRGRAATVVISGDTEPCDAHPRGRARRRRCSCTRPPSSTRTATARARRGTARPARRPTLAREADVGLLALTHLSSRFAPREVRAEAERGLPARARAARLRPDRGPVPGARRARSCTPPRASGARAGRP